MMIEKIFLHHSLTKDSKTVSWGAIWRYHVETLGWRDIGYHYGIELIGGSYQILKGRMDTESGAHVRGHNLRSLGICFVGNFDKAAPPKAQWELGLRLVNSLRLIYRVKMEDILGHRDRASYKSCPGTQFDLDLFRAQL